MSRVDIFRHAFKLEAEIRDLRAKLERAVGVVKSVEWANELKDCGVPGAVACPACGGAYRNHSPSCPLAAVLKENG